MNLIRKVYVFLINILFLIQIISTKTSLCPQLQCFKPMCQNYIVGKFQLEDGIRFKYSIFQKSIRILFFKELFVTVVLFVQNNDTCLFDFTNVFNFYFYQF
jgi:hypothetical protein